MRIVGAALIAVMAGLASGPAHADPYRWCAHYFGPGAASNCYFRTIEQCEAAVSGVGGLCLPNTFYDGRPVEGERPSRRHRRAR